MKSLLDRVSLREARSGDENPLWRLHVEALEATVAPEILRANIAEFCPKPMEDVTALKDVVVMVAELKSEIVGFAGLNVETGWILLMFVTPKLMRKGILQEGSGAAKRKRDGADNQLR